mmetsp:Transcript_8039/g.24166  ORF Transcript_8039/g.24166 Transcript_8039/m.24166 type:complete len:102 (-) Transcript_8039:93-398(-)
MDINPVKTISCWDYYTDNANKKRSGGVWDVTCNFCSYINSDRATAHILNRTVFTMDRMHIDARKPSSVVSRSNCWMQEGGDEVVMDWALNAVNMVWCHCEK